MSQKFQILRSVVEQRLTAAAEEIFGLFERTIAEYEEELCRTKEENQRQRQILECVWNPRVLIHKTDVQQLSIFKVEEWNLIVDQEEPEPVASHIKEELWTSQEVNITKFPSTPFLLKTEDDDELNQTQTEENKVEVNKVDCGGSEPSSSFHLHRHLQTTDEQNEDCEETEDSDEDQTLNHKPESKLPTNSSTEQMETGTDGDDGGGSEPDINLVHMESVKRRTFDSKSLLEEHMDTHTGQKLVGSSECGATFSLKKNMTQKIKSPRDMMKKNEVMLSDVGCKKKVYHCFVCLIPFCTKSGLETHMRLHTKEKPFLCFICGSGFKHNSSLRNHMTSHTRRKTFRCSVCFKWFRHKHQVRRHMMLHEGETSFNCSVCEKRFANKSDLTDHMKMLHADEKRFGCSECGKRYSMKIDLVRHIRTHTGERPFPCVVCNKRFIRNYHLQKHMEIHTRGTMSHSQETGQRRKNKKNNGTGML